MGQSSGMHWHECPLCGQRYRLTNWMRRWPGQRVHHLGKEWWLSNTHEFACARKLGYSIVASRKRRLAVHHTPRGGRL